MQAPSTEIILSTPLATSEIEAGEPSIDIQLALTAKRWTFLRNLDCGEPVTVISADGDYFIGTVQDTDEGRYTVTVELA